MAECHETYESGSGRSLYPALAVAALAGIALTYFFVARRAKSSDAQLPVDKVMNLCNSAADRLEAFAARQLAS